MLSRDTLRLQLTTQQTWRGALLLPGRAAAGGLDAVTRCHSLQSGQATMSLM